MQFTHFFIMHLEYEESVYLLYDEKIVFRVLIV